MLHKYEYKGQTYKVFIHWTADTGNSSVFRETTLKISDKHQFDPGCYLDLARHLDGLTDKLYEEFYIYNDEYSGVPYNPGFRRRILCAFSEITEVVGESMRSCALDWENMLAGLFMNIVDKLTKTAAVYLEDNAYQGKHHYRRVNMEQYSETTNEIMFACDFEDVLLQMNELSRLMDCLTDIQRGRFVKYIILNYTFQEIADHEGVSKQSVQESVVCALKKIQRLLT